MASDEHVKLASTIKRIHRDLRSLSHEIGPMEAWNQHLKSEDTLKVYAQSMRELAENYWTKNATSDDRISWAIKCCENYFKHELEKRRQKDLRILEHLKEEGIEMELHAQVKMMMSPSSDCKLEALDVGSSGNFFENFKGFNILPIDISPAVASVFFCDFLSVPLEDELRLNESSVEALPTNHFHVVIFCLLLEYLPSSDQRIKCCEKAYQVLRTEGILVVVTPDSNHEMKNSKQIKNWRWTLAKIGFQRVKIEKLKNLTCMSFRKSLHVAIPRHWANSHKESYMEFKLEIPQDRGKKKASVESDEETCEFDVGLMNELPFE